MKSFLTQPLTDDELTPGNVPGLGEKGLRALKETMDPPVDTKAKLMGLFLSHNASRDSMVKDLNSHGIQKHHAQTVANAMAEKAQDEVQKENGQTFKSPNKSGGNDTIAMQNFRSQPLRTDPFVQGMVPGVGQAHSQKLQSHGVHTPCELMGLFFLHNRREEWLKNFLKREVGCSEHSLDRYETISSFSERARRFFEALPNSPDPSTPGSTSARKRTPTRGQEPPIREDKPLQPDFSKVAGESARGKTKSGGGFATRKLLVFAAILLIPVLMAIMRASLASKGFPNPRQMISE